MKNALIVPLCGVIALAGGYFGSQLAPATKTVAGEAAGLPNQATSDSRRDLDQTLEDLTARLTRIEAQMDGMQRAPLTSKAPDVIAKASDSTETEASPASSAAPSPEDQAQAWFDELNLDGMDFDAREAIWQKIREAKATDQVIALFEARVAADPGNPDRQTELGQAYLAKIQEVSGPQAGIWADKADKAFDQALSIDDHHVESRFMKAMSLSFWPPVFGKQAQAANQFQILIDQQANSAPSEWQSQAFLMLGNLHMQMGKPDLAKQVFQQGLSIYPGNASIAEQIGLLK